MRNTSLIILSLVIFALAALPKYHEFQKKEQGKKAKAILQTIYTAIVDTRKARGRYPSSLQDAGFIQPSNGYDIFYVHHTVPLSFNEVLPEHFRPYMNDEGFRILISKRDMPNNHYSFCKIDDRNQSECINLTRSF